MLSTSYQDSTCCAARLRTQGLGLQAPLEQAGVSLPKLDCRLLPLQAARLFLLCWVRVPSPTDATRKLDQVMGPLGLRVTHVPTRCQKHTLTTRIHTLMCWVSLRSRDRGLLGMGQILGRSRVSPSLVARRLEG